MTAHDPTPDEHDLGLAHDLPTLLSRRRALGLLSGAGLSAALAACGLQEWASDEPMGEVPSGGSLPPPDQTGLRPETAPGKGDVPAETAGPFPADGSNGRNVLVQTGIVRSDITRSFGGSKGVAAHPLITMSHRTPSAQSSGVRPLSS